jgi:hypothetical protein
MIGEESLVLFLHSTAPVRIDEGAMDRGWYGGDWQRGGRGKYEAVNTSKNPSSLSSHHRMDMTRIAMK